MGQTIKSCVDRFPTIAIAASIQPITRTVLRVRLTIKPEFEWYDKIHGSSEPWWIWVEDPDNQHIYHSEYYLLTKKMVSYPSNSNIFKYFITNNIIIFKTTRRRFLVYVLLKTRKLLRF